MDETEQILTSILRCRRADLYTTVRQVLSTEDQVKFDDIKIRRKKGEPLQYLLGCCDFMGINIHVDSRVLIPRPETEILVEKALENIKQKDYKDTIKILDIGAGSGNISIALAKNIENCHITSVDISQDALELAKYNAKVNFVDDKIDFKCCDLKDFLKGDTKIKFDLIISNPPYIRSEDMLTLPIDVKHEPALALYGGPDGLYFYRFIIKYSHRHLSNNGILICEIGDDQAKFISTLISRNSYYKNLEFIKDYVGTERIFFAEKL